MLLTLMQARNNYRLSVEQVSERTRLSVKRIKELEQDCSNAKMPDILALCEVYRISINHIDLTGDVVRKRKKSPSSSDQER